MSDQDYLNGLKNGDNAVLRRLYDQFLPAIVRLVENNSGSRDDALDTFQEALLVVHRKVKEGNLVLSSSLSTYLYAISRNLWLKRLNKKSFSEVSIQDTAVYTSSDDFVQEMEDQEKYRLFKSKLEQLAGNCRKILEMFFRGVCMEEIATAVGLGSVGYAKKRKFICKEQLLNMIRSDVKFRELSGQ